ncbi:hypothetical protein [Clostridium perfringens]|uniref:hypothetical protein n=1 Tax=Clostridium perfringens TaxID=1502 RepID=UPI00189A3607|nr:hypothetical protein [Clostridium perfringens]ELC8371503.1 hypothetical protein [Clostridium perfringens]MDH5091980.1 hypothetical protein [Clostridium perfringens]MDM0532528.1 hypothetical protein [Clostridium perfringens]WEV17579.1 hypothetical protein PL323_07995 [Clostridium perfringens D]
MYKNFDDIKIGEEKRKLTGKEKKELKKQKKEENKRKKKEARLLKKERKNSPKIRKTVLDEMEELDITDNEFIKTKSGYLNIYQVNGKDVDSLSNYEQEDLIRNFMFFLREFIYDFKIVAMNFPVNTSEQQTYIQKKINITENELYKIFLNEKLEKLIELEKTKTNIEYYIIIFIDKEDSSNDVLNNLIRSTNKDISLSEIDLEKKLKVLYKLNNLNSKIL